MNPSNVAVTFDYNNFDNGTRRDADTRRHSDARVYSDVAGGVYLYGPLGCSKTRPTIREALIDLLGGRELLSFRVFD
jgi:hypothetical protein